MKVAKRVVICGGGTAGWMSAGALARLTRNPGTSVTLIESAEIGTVGVGEATIPSILTYNAMLGIDEASFLRETGGTYKLGIEFVDWGRQGESYFHPFGKTGIDWQGIRFHHYWLSLRQASPSACADTFDTYSVSAQAARLNRFGPPQGGADVVLSNLRYAYHIDAGRYAAFLRAYSEARGVRRVEGRIVEVLRDEASDISGIRLDDGAVIEGDLFLDCTGFRALLSEGALNTGFEDWSHWLPNDSAVVVPSQASGTLPPFTRAVADSSGWCWRIPLQHRTGNGHVYCSHHVSDDQAADRLLRQLDTEAADVPRQLRFQTGRRRQFWNRNCVAIGLAAGFIEPLESTSIHLIQSGISRLLALFPGDRDSAIEREEYNIGMAREYEQARDFIVLHYKATQRDDSDYWRYLRAMDVPASLRRKMDLFSVRGRVFRHLDDLFTEESWLAVLFGQGQFPESYDPLVDSVPASEVDAFVRHVGGAVAQAAHHLSSHASYLAASQRARR